MTTTRKLLRRDQFLGITIMAFMALMIGIAIASDAKTQPTTTISCPGQEAVMARIEPIGKPFEATRVPLCRDRGTGMISSPDATYERIAGQGSHR